MDLANICMGPAFSSKGLLRSVLFKSVLFVHYDASMGNFKHAVLVVVLTRNTTHSKAFAKRTE